MIGFLLDEMVIDIGGFLVWRAVEEKSPKVGCMEWLVFVGRGGHRPWGIYWLGWRWAKSPKAQCRPVIGFYKTRSQLVFGQARACLRMRQCVPPSRFDLFVPGSRERIRFRLVARAYLRMRQ